MITGIENFDTKLQKSILSCIADLFDLTEDIEVKKLNENVIQIDDTKFYVITDDDQQRKIARHNSEAFENFFDGLSSEQLKYVNEDLWEEENGISTFVEWLKENTKYIVEDSDYFGHYNFYEIR